MRFTSALRLVALLVVGSALPGAAASCSKSDAKTNPSSPSPPQIDDVLLKDGATHAALANFASAFPTPWDWGAPFDAPLDGAVLQFPTTFTYHVDVTVCSKNPGGDLGEAGATSDPPVSPDGTFTGEAYLLEFSTPQNPKLLRVFTASAHYTPSQSEWQKLASAGQKISLTLSTGSFESDRLTTTCGPFLGQTISFTVQ